VLRYITRILDDEYLIGLRAMFNAMDTTQSGGLTKDELLAALGKQGCKVRACAACARVCVRACTVRACGCACA